MTGMCRQLMLRGTQSCRPVVPEARLPQEYLSPYAAELSLVCAEGSGGNERQRRERTTYDTSLCRPEEVPESTAAAYTLTRLAQEGIVTVGLRSDEFGAGAKVPIQKSEV